MKYNSKTRQLNTSRGAHDTGKSWSSHTVKTLKRDCAEMVKLDTLLLGLRLIDEVLS